MMLLLSKLTDEFICNFLELETYVERVAEVQRLVDQLPEPNKRMLELLLSHLEKVRIHLK